MKWLFDQNEQQVPLVTTLQFFASNDETTAIISALVIEDRNMLLLTEFVR